MTRATDARDWTIAALALLSCSPSPDNDHSDIAQRVEPLVWAPQQKFTASNVAANDAFGIAVALSGDTAVVGATYFGQGAYVFVRSESSWGEQQELVPTDIQPDQGLGASVAVSGDTLAVAVPNSNAGRGSVYVFVRSGSTWTEQQKLEPSDPEAGQGFGSALALSGDTLLAGSPYDTVGANAFQGSVYAFVRMGTTWSEQQKLTAADGAATDNFGVAVALSGDTALVGASGDDISTSQDQGSAHVFVRSGSMWTGQEVLLAPDGGSQDYFGGAVAVSEATALVGAASDDVGSNLDEGSAYVFIRSDSTWSSQGRLNGAAASAGAAFGWSVALAGDTALVGARGDDVASNNEQGSGFLFLESGTNWSEQAKLTAADGDAGDRFGQAVAVSPDTALVSAFFADSGLSADQGAVYVWAFKKPNGDACADALECHSGLCVDDRCCDAECSGPCDACSTAAGATTDGVCSILAAGASGAPACSPAACTGGSADCAPCSDDSDCTDGAYCDAEGSCAARKAPGAACNLAVDADCAVAGCRACASGYCADGVCCDAECAGQCQACAEPGSEGSCETVTGEPRGSREPCADGASVCGARCDGVEGSECSYAPVTTGCASACTDGTERISTCDGQGQCVEQSPRSCGNYACAADACGTSCRSDSECSTGFRCEDELCAPQSDATSCSPDGLEQLNPLADPTPCVPYICSGSACLETCTSSSDCAPGFACNPGTSHCEPADSAGSGDDGGCGCRMAEQRDGARGLLILALGSVGIWLRRQRKAVA